MCVLICRARPVGGDAPLASLRLPLASAAGAFPRRPPPPAAVAPPAPEPRLGNGQPVREAAATRATAPGSDYIKRFSPQAPPEAAEVADAAAAPQEAATRDHP